MWHALTGHSSCRTRPVAALLFCFVRCRPCCCPSPDEHVFPTAVCTCTRRRRPGPHHTLGRLPRSRKISCFVLGTAVCFIFLICYARCFFRTAADRLSLLSLPSLLSQCDHIKPFTVAAFKGDPLHPRRHTSRDMDRLHHSISKSHVFALALHGPGHAPDRGEFSDITPRGPGAYWGGRRNSSLPKSPVPSPRFPPVGEIAMNGLGLCLRSDHCRAAHARLRPVYRCTSFAAHLEPCEPRDLQQRSLHLTPSHADSHEIQIIRGRRVPTRVTWHGHVDCDACCPSTNAAFHLAI